MYSPVGLRARSREPRATSYSRNLSLRPLPLRDSTCTVCSHCLHSALLLVSDTRYRAESTLNFWVGYLYEVRVAASTAESDRHRHRSENFFYAMLAAQLGAVVSSLALARRHKSALWLVAGLAGLVAVGFGGYVYLTI